MYKVALVVGHRKRSPGAVNKASGLSEFAFNNDLAKFIKHSTAFCEVEIVYRDSYAALPGKINELQPDFIIALHCNAYNEKASGTETLYHHSSVKSKRLAETMQERVVACLGLPDRGIKPRGVEDRGGYLLKNTNAPCVIAEPLFIDNDGDLRRAKESMDLLAVAYIETMREYINYLKQGKA